MKIIPMLYGTILNRAEKRLLNLHSKVKDAPFLVKHQDELTKFAEPLPVRQAAMIAETD